MKEITIHNRDLLESLNESLWFYNHRSELDGIKPQSWRERDQRDWWISEQYLDEVVQSGTRHEGFPEQLHGFNMRDMDSKIHTNDHALPYAWYQKWSDLNKELMVNLSVRNCAVATLYPPGGYISWHNNANATGFNLIFTWSETGDGWLDYIDGNGARQRCADKAGEWVCRYGMFGGYNQDKYPVVYHAASTDCWRTTLAYVFNAEEASESLQQFIIDEITTP